MIQVHHCQTTAQASHQAASAILRDFDANPDVPILFLLSGGSSLAIVDELDPAILSNRVTVGMADERVSTDPEINNFSRLSRTRCYEQAVRAGVTFIDTRLRPGETGDTLVSRTLGGIQRWNSESVAGHRIVVLGIGPDGHTAGMMGYPEHPKQFSRLFEDPTHPAVFYDAGRKSPFPLRVTVTVPFLLSVDYAVCYTVGENKRDALAKTLAPGGETAEVPARILHQMKRVDLFTDLQF